jgi:hypothetical protein
MVNDQLERPLTDDEAALCVAAIAWLKYEMISRLNHDTPSPDLLCDFAQSNFEFGCWALARANILVGEGDYWRVNEGLEKDVSLPPGFNRHDLDVMLDAVAIHVGYHDDFYKVYEGTVPTSALSKALCRALTDCHYMVLEADGKYYWTKDFAPWLVRHGEWALADFEPADDSKVDAVLGLIPREDIELLSDGCRWGSQEFARRFFALWHEDRWSPRSEWRDEPHDGWDLSLAAGLYLRINRTDA